MPRTTGTQITSAFSRVQKQARGLLVGVQREIRVKEADLLRLKKEESQLSAITGQPGTEEAKSASGGSAGATARINWGTVLRTAAEAVQGIPNPYRARAQEQAVL